MTETIIFSHVQERDGYQTQAIAPDTSGNIAVQINYDDTSCHYVLIEITLDGTHYSHLADMQIKGSQTFHVTDLLPGERIRIFSRENCKDAYVLH